MGSGASSGAIDNNARSRAIEKWACRISTERKIGLADAARGSQSDCGFAQLLELLRPRIRRLALQYGLSDMLDDAAQAAAIGVHRALDTFDPTQASFSTHVSWQIRGELQSLRHRMRLDQRRSAVNAGASTVSLDALTVPDSATPFEVVDETAHARTERGASDTMVHAMMENLLDRLSSPEEERIIMYDMLFDRESSTEARSERTPEQRRQIVRRTWRNCIKVLAV